MEAGSYEAWEKISRLPKITDDGNNFVIHCLAGAGRTGSVMLYLLLRDKYDILKKPDGTKFNLAYFQEQIAKPYLGFKDISDFIENIKSAFFYKANNIREIKTMINELFNSKTMKSASLLRQRLNRIFYYLAREYNVRVFYSFPIVAELDKETIKNMSAEDLLKYAFANPYKNIINI
jgi:hypothetical protein